MQKWWQSGAMLYNVLPIFIKLLNMHFVLNSILYIDFSFLDFKGK